MFFEIIRFAMTPEISDDEKEHCFGLLRKLSDIEVVLSVFIGYDHSDGSQSNEGFTHSVIVTMPGDEFYDAYQRHRHHSNVTDYVVPRALKWEVINISDSPDSRLRSR